ncbi:MAG: hypothetical protein JRJ84_22975, partial [Deltaproteobacteria bacterium]|nr:hypothetical protein [Deltaproteobacteria bacterium]
AAATTAWLLPVEPWLRAIVAGVLLHILGHDLPHHPPPGWMARFIDLAAMLAGVLLPLTWLMRSGHHHFPEDPITATVSTTAILLVVVLHGLWLAGIIKRWYPFGHRHEHEQ